MTDLRTLEGHETGHAGRIHEIYTSQYDSFLERDEIESIIYSLNDNMVVAEEDEEIVGAASYFVDRQIAELSNFIVDEEYRGQGIGKKLAEYCIDRSKGYDPALYFACCTTEHVGSQKIFSDLGMNPLGVWKNIGPASDQGRDSLVLLAGFNGKRNVKPLSVSNEGEQLAETVLEETGFRNNRILEEKSYDGDLKWSSFDIRGEKTVFQVFSDRPVYARNSGTTQDFVDEVEQSLSNKDRDYVRIEIESCLGLPETITNLLPEFTLSGFAPNWLWTGNNQEDALMIEKDNGEKSEAELIPAFTDLLDKTGHEYRVLEEEVGSVKTEIQ